MFAAFNASRSIQSHSRNLVASGAGTDHSGSFRSTSLFVTGSGADKEVLTTAGNQVLDQANRTNQATFADNQAVTKTFVDAHEGMATVVSHELVKSANYSSPAGDYQSIRGLAFTVGSSELHADRLLWPKTNWASEVTVRNCKIWEGTTPRLNVYWKKSDGDDGTNYYRDIDLVLKADTQYTIAFYMSSSESGIIRSSMVGGTGLVLGNALSRNTVNSRVVSGVPTTVATHCIGSFRYTLGSARKQIKHLTVSQDAIISSVSIPYFRINDHVQGTALQSAPTITGTTQFIRQSHMRLGSTTSANTFGYLQYNTSTTNFELLLRWTWTNMTNFDSTSPFQTLVVSWLGPDAFDLEIRAVAANKLRFRYIYGSTILKESVLSYFQMGSPYLRMEHHKNSAGLWELACYMYETSTVPLFSAKAAVSDYPSQSTTFLQIGGGGMGLGAGRACAVDLTQISVGDPPRRASIAVADGKIVLTGSVESKALRQSDYEKSKNVIRSGTTVLNGVLTCMKPATFQDMVTVKDGDASSEVRIIGKGASDDGTLLIGANGPNQSFKHRYKGSTAEYQLLRAHGGSDYPVLSCKRTQDSVALSGSVRVGPGVDLSGTFSNIALEVEGGGTHGLLLPRATLSQISAIKSVAPVGLTLFDTTNKDLYLQAGGAWNRVVSDRQSVQRWLVAEDLTSSKPGRLLDGGSGGSVSWFSMTDPIFPQVSIDANPGDRLVLSGQLITKCDTALTGTQHDLASLDIYKTSVSNVNLMSPASSVLISGGTYLQNFDFSTFTFDVPTSLSGSTTFKIIFNYKPSTTSPRHIGMSASRCFIRVARMVKTTVPI